MTAVETFVTGTPGLALDIAVHLLSRSSVSTPASSRVVGVLVEPQDRHWDEVAAAGAGAVVLTGSATGHELVELVRRGADAVLDRTAAVGEVLDAVAIVASGQTYLSSVQARVLADTIRRDAATTAPLVLTGRERQILQSVERGESVKQTARRLEVSSKTIENLQSRLFRKLGARNRAQAVAAAYQRGLLDGPEPGACD